MLCMYIQCMVTYNTGVLSDILDYVLEPSNVIQREATPGPDQGDSRGTVRFSWHQ